MKRRLKNAPLVSSYSELLGPTAPSVLLKLEYAPHTGGGLGGGGLGGGLGGGGLGGGLGAGGLGGGLGGGGDGGGDGGGGDGGGAGGAGGGGGATPEHTALFFWVHVRAIHSPPLLLVSTCTQSSQYEPSFGSLAAQLVYMPAVSGTS